MKRFSSGLVKVTRLFLVGSGVAGAVTASSPAAITFFTSRAAWLTAIGATNFAENFESFNSDTAFNTTPLTLSGMTIAQEGENLNFRNLVDVSPFAFPDNNGTKSASLYTNAPEPGTPGTQVRITFDDPNKAFGGESTLGGVQEGATLEVYDGALLLGFQMLSPSANAFLGYSLTGGTKATSVRFVSTTLISNSTGEGFGYDNIAGIGVPSAVPEPGTLAVGFALTGAMAAGRFGRRRQSAV